MRLLAPELVDYFTCKFFALPYSEAFLLLTYLSIHPQPNKGVNTQMMCAGGGLIGLVVSIVKVVASSSGEDHTLCEINTGNSSSWLLPAREYITTHATT